MAATDPIKLLEQTAAGFDKIAASIKKIKVPKKSKWGKELQKQNQLLIEQNKKLAEQITAVLKANQALAKEAGKAKNTMAKSTAKAVLQEDELRKKTEQTKKALRDQKKETSTFMGRINADLRRQMAWYPSKAFLFAIGNAMRAIPRVTMEYGNALVEVGSVARTTDKELNSLNATILEVGKSSKFSIVELAKATKTLAQAGLRGEELTNAIDPSKNLATATSSSMEAAVKVQTTILRAYKLSANDFIEISDSLTNAVTSTRLTLDDLNVAFSYVASAAAQTGVSFKETITLLGILKDSGLEASTAATGLRMALLKITAPTHDAQKVLTKVGLSEEDLDIANKGIKEVLKNLFKLSKVNLIKIFGARSANAILALKNAGVEAFEAQIELIKLQGSAAQISQEQMGSLQNSWNQFKNDLQTVAVNIGGVFKDNLILSLKTAADLIIQLEETFKGLGSILSNIVTPATDLFVAFGAYKGINFIVEKTITEITKLSKAISILKLQKEADTAATILNNTAELTSEEASAATTAIKLAEAAAREENAAAATAESAAMTTLSAGITVVVAAVVAAGFAMWEFAKAAKEAELAVEKTISSMAKLKTATLKNNVELKKSLKYSKYSAEREYALEKAKINEQKNINDTYDAIAKQFKNNPEALKVIEASRQATLHALSGITDPSTFKTILKTFQLNYDKLLKDIEKTVKHSSTGYAVSAEFGDIESAQGFSPSQLKNTQKIIDKTKKKIEETKKISGIFSDQTYINAQKASATLNDELKNMGDSLEDRVMLMNDIKEHSKELRDANKEIKVEISNLAGKTDDASVKKLTALKARLDENNAWLAKLFNWNKLKIDDTVMRQAIDSVKEAGYSAAAKLMQKFKTAYSRAINKEGRTHVVESFKKDTKIVIAAAIASAAKERNLSVEEFKKNNPNLVKDIVTQVIGDIDNTSKSADITRKLNKLKLTAKKFELQGRQLKLKGIKSGDDLDKLKAKLKKEHNARMSSLQEQYQKDKLDKDKKEIATEIWKTAKLEEEARYQEDLQKADYEYVKGIKQQLKVIQTNFNVEGLFGADKINAIEHEKKVLQGLLELLKADIPKGEQGGKMGEAIGAVEKRLNKLTKSADKVSIQQTKDQISFLNSSIAQQTTQRDYLQELGFTEDVKRANESLAQSYDDLFFAQVTLAAQTTKDPDLYAKKIAKLYEWNDAMHESLDTTKLLVKEYYQDIYSGFSEGFEDFFSGIIKGNKSVVDAFRDMGNKILNIFEDMIAKMAAKKMMDVFFGSTTSGLGGAIFSGLKMLVGSKHHGGVISNTTPKYRHVEPSVFANAPRFHSGLLNDEFPAILQKGEQVIPKNTRMVTPAPKVTINMENNTKEQVSFETTSSHWDGEEFVVNTIIKNINSNGPLRALVQGG